MPFHWYAIHSHPLKEEHLWNQLLLINLEAFYPRLRVKPVNPRARKIKPYFPGYLFVQADLDQTGLSTFQWMPYSTGLVCFGGEPSIVPDHLISVLRKKIEEIGTVGGEILDGLVPGDPVKIQAGPFAGFEAIFDTRVTGSERVRVLLKMLNQRRLPVELDTDQIQRIKKPPKT
jgi:transcription antitermination factor NusG